MPCLCRSIEGRLILKAAHGLERLCRIWSSGSHLARMEISAFINKWMGVTGGAERAAEEREGKVRWLRPDYQIPRFGAETA